MDLTLETDSMSLAEVPTFLKSNVVSSINDTKSQIYSVSTEEFPFFKKGKSWNNWVKKKFKNSKIQKFKNSKILINSSEEI